MAARTFKVKKIKEFEITVQLRNNLIKERRKKLGLSLKQLCQAIHVNEATVGGLERLQKSPINKKYNCWTKSVVKLANFFMTKPEQLFPDAVLEIKKSTATRKLDAGEVSDILSDFQILSTMSPEELYFQKELREKSEKVIKTLGTREEVVLRRRFGTEAKEAESFRKIGEDFKVTSQRIKQIEAKALRKLKHPLRSKQLKGFIE